MTARSPAFKQNVKTLIETFDLTQAEACLAVALVETHDLTAAATECGVTIGTARQYLKRVFNKTQTKGQVDLVLTLSTLFASR